jgi:hypothetical protein
MAKRNKLDKRQSFMNVLRSKLAEALKQLSKKAARG